MTHTVFVFGTLKQGFPNFATNRGTRVPGDFVTVQVFPLYLVGERRTPWMIDLPGQGHRVAGQLYEVDDAALALMDELERIHEADGYRRVAIEVVPAGGDASAAARSAFAYLKPAAHFEQQSIRQGPYAEYTAEHAALYRPRERAAQ